VADQQKSLFKMSLRAAGRPDELYVGGLYASSRHANYFGEMVFWAGSFVAGLPAVVSGAVPLYVRLLRGIASGLGLAGIFFIMLSATKRLEGRQAEKYRPSAAYDKYYLMKTWRYRWLKDQSQARPTSTLRAQPLKNWIGY